MEVLSEQMEHLRTVEREREHYNKMVHDAKEVAKAAGITCLGPHTPNSSDCQFHYSFDFAQQVHLPHSPLQVGPLYFLVPRKVGIFGVCAEGLPQQINYLIDEGMSSGKGSNMVISLLHHFLENYGLGEKHIHIHCDNCAGQNKNKFVMWYLAWRIMRGLHTSISVNFMPAGHTKFAPDWCFGLLKRKFIVCEVHCLADMCHVVETSSTRGINKAQLVGTETQENIVAVYDWQTYFHGCCRALKGIKSNYHFRFTADSLGTVFYKRKLDDVEFSFQLCNSAETVQQRLAQMPAEVAPPGLSQARQEYLRHFIRPFVRSDKQDILCP